MELAWPAPRLFGGHLRKEGLEMGTGGGSGLVRGQVLVGKKPSLGKLSR